MNEMLVQYRITLGITFASAHYICPVDSVIHILTTWARVERGTVRKVSCQRTQQKLCPQQVARAYYCEAITPPLNPECLMLIIRLSVISCTTVY